MNMHSIKQLGFALLICAVPLSMSCKASDKKTDEQKKAEMEAQREAEEAQAEEEAVRDDFTKKIKTFFVGKLTLNDPNGSDASANPAVVGVFQDKDGGSYQVKLANKDLMKVVAPYNGKTVAVLGCLRNKGKYLVVSIVSSPTTESSPGTIRSRRRSGA